MVRMDDFIKLSAEAAVIHAAWWLVFLSFLFSSLVMVMAIKLVAILSSQATILYFRFGADFDHISFGVGPRVKNGNIIFSANCEKIPVS